MSQAIAVAWVAGLLFWAGIVLMVLGGVLWLIDRRFDDPPEARSGRKLLRLGPATTLAAFAASRVLAVFVE